MIVQKFLYLTDRSFQLQHGGPLEVQRLAEVDVVRALWVGDQGAVSVESDRPHLPPRFVRFLRFIVQSGASDATPV